MKGHEGKTAYVIHFTELADSRKRHWRKIWASSRESAVWTAKWIAIAKDWLVED